MEETGDELSSEEEILSVHSTPSSPEASYKTSPNIPKSSPPGTSKRVQPSQQAGQSDYAAREIEVGTPTWKGLGIGGLYNEAYVLSDIHKAVLSLHVRVDAVEATVCRCMDSLLWRQSTPLLSGATGSSGSDSCHSFSYFSADEQPSKSAAAASEAASKGATHSETTGFSDSEGSHVRQGAIDETCRKLGLSPNLVKVIDKESHSRKNLASKLVCQVFSLHERGSSNVMGLKGKKRLNPTRMDMVKSLTFTMRPIKPGEIEEDIWRKECIKAIDSTNRNIKH